MAQDVFPKYARITASPELLLVNSERKLTTGMHLNMMDAVAYKLGDLHRIGSGIRAALDRFQVGEPVPDWSEIRGLHEAQLADAAGVKSFRALVQGGIKQVLLTWTPGQIMLDPMKHERGATFVNAKGVIPVIVPDTVSNEELGTAAIEAVSRAQ